MLAEWFERLLTTCPRPIREMGYLHELVGIRKSGRRCADAWAPHFENGCNIIRSAILRCPQRRKAVIFGSGWLNDVPLDELADSFREVVLVDILHPFAVRRRVRRRPNVRLLTADVTGTIYPVYQAAHTGGPLPESVPNLFVDDPEVDLAASVMLLTQVHYFQEQYLIQAGRHAVEEVAEFARSVVHGHFNYLKRLPGTVALITDVEHFMVSTTARVIRRFGLLRGLELPKEDAHWTWALKPGSPGVRQGQYREVVGIINLKD
jgi:hypothetical protein